MTAVTLKSLVSAGPPWPGSRSSPRRVGRATSAARPACRSSRIAFAAILQRASRWCLAPTSLYGPAPSMFRPAAQPRTLAPWRCVPSGRGPLHARASFWRRSWVAADPIATRLDHVQHHLHARADALDEVRLGHEVARAADDRACRPRRRRGRRRRGDRAAARRPADRPARRRGGAASAPVVIAHTIRRNRQFRFRGGCLQSSARFGASQRAITSTAMPLRCA